DSDVLAKRGEIVLRPGLFVVLILGALVEYITGIPGIGGGGVCGASCNLCLRISSHLLMVTSSLLMFVSAEIEYTAGISGKLGTSVGSVRAGCCIFAIEFPKMTGRSNGITSLGIGGGVGGGAASK